MPSSLAFPDKLPLPLLSRHRLSADLLALLYLHAVDEHAEVLADRDQRRVLVVKLHAQRSVHPLPDFRNRGGRLLAGPVGFQDPFPYLAAATTDLMAATDPRRAEDFRWRNM